MGRSECFESYLSVKKYIEKYLIWNIIIMVKMDDTLLAKSNLIVMFCNLIPTKMTYPISPSRSCDWHPANPRLRPALLVLAAAARLHSCLALLCGIPAAGRGARGRGERGDSRGIGCCSLGLAEIGGGDRDLCGDWQAGDGQCVCAEGERLQQGRLWWIQWGSIFTHTTSSR